MKALRFLLMYTFYFSIAQGAELEDETAVLTAIADLAEANFFKFPYGSLHLRHLDGFASNSRDARFGNLDRLAIGDCNYRFSANGRAFYERRYPADVLRSATVWTSATSSNSRLFAMQGVTNGDLSLIEKLFTQKVGSFIDGAPACEVGAAGFYSLVDVPMRLGFPEALRGDVSKLLRTAIKQPDEFRTKSKDLKAVYEGNVQAHFVFASAEAEEELWVDLEKGATLNYGRSAHRLGSVVEVFNDKIEFIAGHGWLPHVRTVYINKSRVQRIVLDRFDFDTPLGPDAFTLTLSAPKQIVHPVTHALSPRSTTYNMDRLPSSFTQGKSLTQTASSIPPALPGEVRPLVKTPRMQPTRPQGELEVPSSPQWLLWGTVALGLIALGGALLYWTRRR